MDNEKIYFVSYNFTDEKKNFGFGNVDVTVTNGIQTMDDVRDVQNYLCNKNNFKSLVILNYIELEVSE